MAKNKSCVTILPSSSNITFNKHKDEFNIKTNDSLKLPLLQDGKGVIQSHVYFSQKGNYKALYSNKFRTYKRTKRYKYDKLISTIYPYLDPKELYKIKLNDEEVKVTDIKFMKVCLKCSKECYNESGVVKCGGWYENSKETNSCTYWIHKNINCCQTVSNVDYCPNCFKLQ